VTACIDIVIVNWNAGDLLSDAIASIRACHDGLVAKLVVVDNGSSDGSMEAATGVAGAMPMPVCFERNAENRGFGVACNQGARIGGAPYLLFLNPDARIGPGVLRRLVDFLQAEDHAHYAVVGPQLIDERGDVSRSCARFPSPVSFIAQSLGLARLGLFSSSAMHMHEWTHDRSRDVDHVIGAFYLVRRAVFERLGGFDERFFVYLEDIDLSRRIDRNGGRIRFCADVQAFHAGGGTSRKVKAARLFYALRSRIQYAFKHFDPVGAWSVCAAIVLVEPVVRVLGAIARRGGALDTCRAFAMLYRDLPNLVSGKRCP